ncbi:MAG: DUF6152 family protein, partial [Gammaproteobacteria bacterium]|nr:DUF6152 family protein [Gammaproteobacteria bacterium]
HSIVGSHKAIGPSVPSALAGRGAFAGLRTFVGLGTFAGLTAFAAGGAAFAHHGIANFDLNADLELEGIIRDVEFLNPHSWVYFTVIDDEGGTADWRCEMRGATVLRRSGWTEDMFVIGTPITISGSPDRQDPTTCYLGTAVFADGSSVDRYGQLRAATPVTSDNRPLRLANGQPNISGDWAAEQQVMTDPRGQMGTLVRLSQADQFEPGETPGGGPGFPGARGTSISLADDPVDAYWNRRPTSMPLTAAGEAAIADLDFSTGDNPRLRCAPTNILFDWYFEMDVNRIVQTGDAIKMYYGAWGLERTIHLDVDTHPADIEPSRAGHSIGRWEDDVLVVDTIGFLPGILNADGRVPHSGELHVVERFSLGPNGQTLRREYVASDPLYFEGEFRGSDTMLIPELPYRGTTPCEERTYR